MEVLEIPAVETGIGHKVKRHTKKVLKGNYAASEAVKLCRVGFVPSYPITPQTTIVESIATMVASKEMNATYVNMDSEHSVFAAAKGASIVGERVFTATSGQGLLYSHEVLHAIAHMRLPIVAVNVGRPSFPWNIWCDQSDSLAQRDTGWIQFYGENSQEVLDTIIQAYKMSEHLLLPVMVVLDAFYQSHTNENVWIPEQSLVDEFLPAKKNLASDVNVDEPKVFGGLVATDIYDKFNNLYWRDMNKVEDLTNATGKDFEEYFGRNYAAVEGINIHSTTKMILVTLSSITTTARGVIKDHPDVGILKIRLMKPFPKKSVWKVLEKIDDNCKIICIERNFLGDNEGALMHEMKRALYGKRNKMFDVFAGLGGKDVPPSTIEKIIEKGFHDMKEVTWIDLE